MLLVSESTKQLPRGSSTWLHLEVVTGIPVGTGRVAFIWNPSCIVLHGMFDSISIDLCFHRLLLFHSFLFHPSTRPLPPSIFKEVKRGHAICISQSTHSPNSHRNCTHLWEVKPRSDACSQDRQPAPGRLPEHWTRYAMTRTQLVCAFVIRQPKTIEKKKEKKFKERLRMSATHGDRTIQRGPCADLCFYFIYYSIYDSFISL